MLKLRRTSPPTSDRAISTLDGLAEFFAYQNQQYPLGLQRSLRANRVDIENNFVAYVDQVHRQSGLVAAAVTARALLLSELRFKWRSVVDADNGRLFGNQELGILEQPSPSMTRTELLTVAETHSSYTGNVYLWRDMNTIRVLRPDWVSILLGSNMVPADFVNDVAQYPDAVPVAYIYSPGGLGSSKQPIILAPSEVAHWKPEPDPVYPWRGMSWVTSVLREIGTDRQAQEFKAKFFENGATPQLVVSLDTAATKEQIENVAASIRERHEGTENAFRTLVLAGGTDAKVVGSDLSELSLRDTQGQDETRIASRSRVPAVVLGISEGMQGSALNAGNYSQTRRLWADGWFTPYAAGFCAAMERILTVPPTAELAYDPARITFLQEDRKDEAEIMSHNAAAIRQLVDGGFDPTSVIEAIATNDVNKLRHSGQLSVQLQPPGAQFDSPTIGSNDDATV